jgi:hypothetical protein
MMGGDELPRVDEYRRIAAELRTRAKTESKEDARKELLALALAYVRLADMAERNRLTGANHLPKDT